VSTWDIDKAIANFEKHGVPFEEAATIFGDPEGLDWSDEVHSHDERRFKRLGRLHRQESNDDKETIRIIGARPASRKEREAYARPED
jgi:uncharacterized DUF497 family protein